MHFHIQKLNGLENSILYVLFSLVEENMFFRKKKTSPCLDLGFPYLFSHPRTSEPEVLLLMAFEALLGFLVT